MTTRPRPRRRSRPARSACRLDPFDQHPAQRRGGGGEVRGDERAAGQAAGRQGAAGVEAEPADPQQRRADHAQHDAVRRHRHLGRSRGACPGPGADQGRDAGADMHDRAAGEVERGDTVPPWQAAVEQPALAPDHVGQRAVDDQQPEDREEQHRAELHALGVRAADQRRRDDREHAAGRPSRSCAGWSAAYSHGASPTSSKEREAESADEWVAVVERQAVADDRPDDADDGHQDEALHHRRQDVLAADQAAVEQRQARAGHHQHQARSW